MTKTISDEEFLKIALCFCEKVDCYADVLELVPLKVLAFKSNKIVLDFAYSNREHFDSFKKSAIQKGILKLKIIFSELIEQSINSPNYTAQIARDLGFAVGCNETEGEKLTTGYDKPGVNGKSNDNNLKRGEVGL